MAPLLNNKCFWSALEHALRAHERVVCREYETPPLQYCLPISVERCGLGQML